ncbi:MAG: PadR family transcriptional regulator [Deltaproteobacteria bacterium]|nr:PadR family transcriptional regulator [Deltaproteobacteria bacterium]
MNNNPSKLTDRSREKRTRYVVLGMLLQGPANGYAIQQRISTSVGNFWQESFGQIYPTLVALEAEGLVRTVPQPTNRKGTQAYEITPPGRLALREWVARPPQPQPERNELLLKVFFAELDPDAVAEHVARAQSDARLSCERLKEMATALKRELGAHPSLPAWLATIAYGVVGQQTLATWCEKTAGALGRMPSDRRKLVRKRSGR